jgi:cell division protein FtsB
MRRRQKPMTKLHRRRGFLRAIWMPLVTAAFLGYFGYHAFTGAFGIWSMDRLTQETGQLSTQLADLRAQREALEAKVARMRPESLDADLVDSSARTALNVMRADELILAPAAAR